MIETKPCRLPLIVAIALLTCPAAAKEQAAPWPPTFTHSKIAITPGGYHATTRGTIRLVFPHEGKWLVFRGRPNTYHFSADGRTWTATEAPQASRSHLIEGSRIYTFYSVLVEPAPKWVFDKFLCQGTISGTTIRWGKPHKVDTRVSYYPDLKRDATGRFTMSGRHAMRGEGKTFKGTEVVWQRTVRPNDVSEWEPEVRCIHHTGDAGQGGDSWKRIGSTAHENLTLEDGKSCVIALMTVDGVGKLYANLHDGQAWSREDMELATGMSTWAGTDRRMCAVFDKLAKVIHLAYVDGKGGLWYRQAKTPYGIKDWSAPARLQPFRTFTVVLSLDTSRTPAQVYALFGKTLFEDRGDLRNTYGALYLQRLDGTMRSDPVQVSEPATKDNWYPNMNADLNRGIGILYLKGARRTRPGKKPPLDIMFATAGAPR